MPTIKLFASLRKLAGLKELSSPGTTLGEILNDLVLRYPSLEGAILESGTLRPNIIITLNGQNTTDPNVAVTEEDTIAIFPPIAGG
jgi:molybdopterin synthase sulfur carrier subunit